MPPATETVTTTLDTSGTSVTRMTACAPFLQSARSRHAEAKQEQQGSKRKAPAVPRLYGALAVQLTGFLGYSQFALWVVYTFFDSRMHCRRSYLVIIQRNTRSIAYLFGFSLRTISIFCAQGRQVKDICTSSVIRRRAGRIEPLLDRGRTHARQRTGVPGVWPLMGLPMTSAITIC